MLSKSLANYPQFRFKEGEKRLWNPILKKSFNARPEERVRLSLVDYFLIEANIPKSRLAFESPVKLTQDENTVRSDIICYDQDFSPKLLVECKAPEIKLNEKAAVQIARYNQKVNAPYLLISNGWLDFWFESNGEKVKSLNKIPEIFQPKNKPELSYDYWQERGFFSEKLSPAARKFTIQNCRHLFSDPTQPVKYLQFDEYSPEFALSHYYRIFGLQENVKIGVTLAANPYGGTRLNAVLNQNGANTAFLSASIDLLAEDVTSNTEIHSARGMIEVDLKNEAAFSFDEILPNRISSFRDLLIKYS